MAFRARSFYFVDPLKYISFFSFTLKNLMYFSGLKKRKILSFRTRIFMFNDPLKYTSFFSLTLQNLVYFSGPNWSLKVHCTIVDGGPVIMAKIFGVFGTKNCSFIEENRTKNGHLVFHTVLCSKHDEKLGN